MGKERNADEDNDDDSEDRRHSRSGRLDRRGASGVRPRDLSDPGSSGEGPGRFRQSQDARLRRPHSRQGRRGAAQVGDVDEDAENLKEFNEAAAASTAIEDGPNGAKILRVGKNGWTLPLPLIKTEAGWRFDVAKGKEEMTNRRVGYNELSAIEACKAYVAAQDEYFKLDRDGDGLREYARRIVSTPGRHDGLYWPPENRPIFRRSTDSLKTPTWPSVLARSQSLMTAITSAS